MKPKKANVNIVKNNQFITRISSLNAAFDFGCNQLAESTVHERVRQVG